MIVNKKGISDTYLDSGYSVADQYDDDRGYQQDQGQDSYPQNLFAAGIPQSAVYIVPKIKYNIESSHTNIYSLI